jgi:hypothetical protein
MSVDRLSVTVPADMGAVLRALARSRRATVSTVVTEAIARELRLAALDGALAEADRRFGALPEDRVTRAMAELARAPEPARPRRRRRTG